MKRIAEIKSRINILKDRESDIMSDMENNYKDKPRLTRLEITIETRKQLEWVLQN